MKFHPGHAVRAREWGGQHVLNAWVGDTDEYNLALQVGSKIPFACQDIASINCEVGSRSDLEVHPELAVVHMYHHAVWQGNIAVGQ